MPTGHPGSPPPFAQLLGLPLGLPWNPILLFQAISAASCWLCLPHAPRTRPLLTTLAWTTLLGCLLPSAPYALSHVAPTGVTPLPCLKPPTHMQNKVQSPHRDPWGPMWPGQSPVALRKGHTAPLLLPAQVKPGPSSELYSWGDFSASVPSFPSPGLLSWHHLFREALPDHLHHSGKPVPLPTPGAGFLRGLVPPDTSSYTCGFLYSPLSPRECKLPTHKGFV